MPSSEDTLKKALDEMAPPNEPSLKDQQLGDVEMQLAEPIPKQVYDDPEGSTGPAEPIGVELMEVEEELQRVQQAIHPEIKVSPPEVTFVYRRSRSSSLLPQSEGGLSSSGDPP